MPEGTKDNITNTLMYLPPNITINHQLVIPLVFKRTKPKPVFHSLIYDLPSREITTVIIWSPDLYFSTYICGSEMYYN